MRQYIILLLSITVIGSSCIKDRLQPTVTTPVTTPASDTLMYYWSFNGADSSDHAPDFAVSLGSSFKYYASYIDFTTGTPLNKQGTTDSGTCLRVRNPSDSVIFHMPTSGFDSISLSFAEQRSGSGSSQNAVYYTVDGVNYITTALTANVYTIDTVFAVHTFNFSTDPNVKHNANFAVKIKFVNNNTGTSGNDRFDNVALFGVRK